MFINSDGIVKDGDSLDACSVIILRSVFKGKSLEF